MLFLFHPCPYAGLCWEAYTRTSSEPALPSPTTPPSPLTWYVPLHLPRGPPILYCKTDESHVPHKFAKMLLGLMTNVISPNSIKIRVMYPLSFGQIHLPCAFCASPGWNLTRKIPLLIRNWFKPAFPLLSYFILIGWKSLSALPPDPTLPPFHIPSTSPLITQIIFYYASFSLPLQYCSFHRV